MKSYMSFYSLHRITWWLTHLEYENKPATSVLWRMTTWWNSLIWKVKMTSGHALAGMTVTTPMDALTAFGWKSTYWCMGKNPPCHQSVCISILIGTLFAIPIGDFKRTIGKTLFCYHVFPRSFCLPPFWDIWFWRLGNIIKLRVLGNLLI